METPTPAPPPPPPVKQPQPQKPTPPVKQPVKPTKEVKPPAAVQSATHQQHDVKNPLPLSKDVLNTLSKLRVNQKQDKPPTAQYNPDQGGAPHGAAARTAPPIPGSRRLTATPSARMCARAGASMPGRRGCRISPCSCW
ncbi:hypothetical protein GT370_06640 [Acidocella sp. MX-AZ03]|uniref:hypothetical protein n=1 Tax=Acidocella sp. MX-AZ03 TaxID=2697363 RepID=UPI0022DD0353|nr:hypothetical protein [Acidocella sp. MX-AZ03]WBO60456.1 hypothetical protein GT370_06640 [Acidocella sp. MX-AZ03]